jgi:hypothetical protein
LQDLNKYTFIKKREIQNKSSLIKKDKKKFYSNIKLINNKKFLEFNSVLEMSKYFKLSYRHALRLVKEKKYKQYKIEYNYG